MIDLSFNELKLIAQYRNISNDENKSKEDLIKALSRPKPKLVINKKKLEEDRKDFYNLRYKFSKKDADKYRKVIYDIKNHWYFSELEIEETRKKFNELEKILMLEKPRDDIDSVYYEDLDNYDDDDDDNNINDYDYVYRKIGSVRRLFKKFDIDYYKPILNDSGLDGIINSYMEYTSNGDRYENLLPEEYLNLMRPYLTDLINKHITTMELNNNNNSDNNNNNNNNNDNNNNNNTDRGEWKIQLTMINSCISTKSFKDKHTIYLKSEQVEIYMGSDTENVIDTLFNTLLQNFQCAQETSNDRGNEFIPDSVELLRYEFQRIDIRRANHICLLIG